MNAEILLAHYGRIAEAPDAVARLRRLVLDLAVRGKLVPQDPRDASPTLELLAARARIEAAVARTRRLRWQPSKQVLPEELPKDLPRTWIGARINDTGLYINGLAFKPADWKPVGLPIIRIQNLTDPSREFNFAEGPFPAEVVVEAGDILVSWSATLDAFKWSGERGVLNQHIFRVIRDESLTHPDFLLMILRQAVRAMAAGRHARGLVMTHINRGPFLNHVIGLPPIAEQHRIVEKVDELMALCDQLEAARETRETTRDRLAAASLGRLGSADPETFVQDARLALKALPALTARPDQIRQIRQTILNLAVRGKLVPQDVNEEQVSSLVARIRADCAQRQRGRSRSLEAPRILEGEAPYSIPQSWAWHRFGDIILCRDGERVPVSKEERSGRAKLYDYYGASGVIDQIDGYLFEQPLLLIGEDGANLINRSTPIAFMARGRYWVNNHAHVIDGVSEDFLRYLALYINATDLKPYVTGTAQPKMNQAKMNSIPIALPPEPEQKRILTRVNELMALCDALEASLARAATTQSRLLEATITEALAPARERALEAAE